MASLLMNRLINSLHPRMAETESVIIGRSEMIHYLGGTVLELIEVSIYYQ